VLKVLQKDVGGERGVLSALDKLATQLKYSSQKQDVVLIKNLLASVQHRWDRVGLRVAERSRQLDQGYREARMFHDSWEVRTLDRFRPKGCYPSGGVA